MNTSPSGHDKRNWSRRHSLAGVLFAWPWLIGFLLFIVYPFAASAYWSFCQFDLIRPARPVGSANYHQLTREIIAGDGFGLALQNTVYLTALSVPLSIALGIGLAVMLSLPIRGQPIYRTIFYLPAMVPVVASSILWLWLLDPQDGLVNYGLSWFGLEPQNWLTQARSAISIEGGQTVTGWLAGENRLKLFGSKDALILISLWSVGNFMVIYLAAIGDIPPTLYEAAKLDGAGPWKRFRHVTLPLLSPVIFFNLVMGIIRSVQTFTEVYILSEGTGAPGNSLQTFSLHLFLSAFSDLRMGYASAAAWVMFGVLLVTTLLIFRSARYWVYYRAAS